MPTCITCILWSSGFDEINGPGYCYSEGDFTDPDYYCPFWTGTLRENPVNDPPLITLWDEDDIGRKVLDYASG